MKILPFLWEACEQNEIWPHPVLIGAMLPSQQLSCGFYIERWACAQRKAQDDC